MFMLRILYGFLQRRGDARGLGLEGRDRLERGVVLGGAAGFRRRHEADLADRELRPAACRAAADSAAASRLSSTISERVRQLSMVRPPLLYTG